MKRMLFFAYGVACYAGFMALYPYMAGFVGNFLVPKSIDSGGPSADLATAIVVDLALIALFALQHSVMARPTFKNFWTRIVPSPIERSTYVLFSCVVTVVLMVFWIPIDEVVWEVQGPLARTLVWVLFAVGWLLVPGVSYLINHHDLFGTRQVWLHLKGLAYDPPPFRVPGLYRVVRHPLYIGWAIAFWAIPTMTVGHLLFAGAMTLYMGVAAIFEERNLLEHYGEQYRKYRESVPMFVPRVAVAQTMNEAGS